MNEKIFSHFTEKNYLSRTDNIVQLHFWHKYSFQRAPNQVEKLRKFQGVGGYDKHPLESNKCPPWERGGGFQKKAGIVFKRKQNNLLT